MKTREINCLLEFLAHASHCYGENTALQHANDAGRDISFSELQLQAHLGAACLTRLDPVEGKPVLLLMEACPEWAASFFAILAAGKIAVPLVIDMPVEEIAGLAAHAGIETAILGQHARHLTPALKGCRTLYPADLFKGDLRQHNTRVAADDTAVLAFTSGSTRQPRAVELTHANLMSNLNGLRSVRQAGPNDVFLSVLPPAHLFELTVGLLAPLSCGATIVYAGTHMPNRILDYMRDFEITHTLAVPALVESLYLEVLFQLSEAEIIDPSRGRQQVAETARRIQYELSQDTLEKIRLGTRSRFGFSLHTLVVGGAAIENAYSQVLKAIGINLELGYGLTEASPIVSIGLAADCPNESVGKPLPNIDVRIDEGGEILVKGRSVMKRYFKDPSSTHDVLHDGWLRTGDRGKLDSQGFLFIEGRIKEAMVTRSGETIYPDEVECYYAHPMLAESCVAALRGEDGNDVPTLFAIPASDDISDEQLDEVFKGLKRNAPNRYKVPQMIRLNQALPRTATGKVRRRLVAESLEQRNSVLDGHSRRSRGTRDE